MRRLLSAASVPESTLQLLHPIVDTCRVCRQWARPGPRNINSLSLHTRFNDAVQVDLMFYRDWTVFMMADSAIRWKVAEFVPGRDAETLAEALILR